MKKRHMICAMALLLLLAGCNKDVAPSATPVPTPGETPVTPSLYAPGTYTAEADGYGGAVQVAVEVDGNSILSVEVVSNAETEGVGSKAVESLPKLIVERQSVEVDDESGATMSSTAIKKAVTKALNIASGNEDANVQVDEKAPTLYDEGWSIKPAYGILKGDYFREEELFRQGHTGILEVVTSDDGAILMVEFNETGRPNYYTRLYQGQNKRLSEYNFTMGERKGVAFIQGVLAVEKQMIDNQSLTDLVDTVSGASNSVQQAMLPMAEKISTRLSEGSTQKYYSIAEDIGGGLSGKLEVLVENGKIVDCRYDELFGDNPEDIEDEALKQHYRTSKYESIYFEEPSRIGFNIQMDALNDKVVETQDLFDLTGLPAIEDSGDYKTSGYTLRNTAWDNYLSMAEKLHAEMVRDGVLK